VYHDTLFDRFAKGTSRTAGHTALARFLSFFLYPSRPQSKTSAASVLGSMKPAFH
jgi:hypothetical protein